MGHTQGQAPWKAACLLGFGTNRRINEPVLDGLHRLSRGGRPDLARTVIMLFLKTMSPMLQDAAGCGH